MNRKTIIVGGGVIGLCCAYFLNQQGHDVTIIDRSDITTGTSFGNAGYISPSHFVPLASPGIIAKGLRWMMSSSSPFYIKPRFDLGLVQWLLQFFKSANRATAEQNTRPLLDLLNLSRDLTCSMRDVLQSSFMMEEKGCLMLYKSPSTEKHELELAAEANKLGIETEVCSAAEVQLLEPDVEVDVRGGILYPGDCHIHPGQFMRSLKLHLEARGVVFMLNTEVERFEKEGKKIQSIITNRGKLPCDEIVLAAGSWMPLLLRELQIKLLLQAGKGYSMTFSNINNNLQLPAILVDHRVAMTPLGSDLRMGGTMEISGINSRILPNRVRAIYEAAKLYYPSLQTTFPQLNQVWSGLRPLSPDGLPYIGRPSQFQNLTIAGGHAMLGISLAAVTGKLVEAIVNQTKPQMPINPFRVDRFG